jgi:hypothetical protein
MRSAFALMATGCLASIASASIDFGPSPYLSIADSPFASSPGFQLEDFEDNVLNILGVTASFGGPIGPGGNIDSVDADNGPIDGLGASGRSFFSGSGSLGIQFFFDLELLPQRAGLVWTDGAGTITFQAFDANNQLITTISGTHADGSFNSTTGEDRFYGVEHAAGIASIKITNSSGGIEVDHLQYAYIPTPGGVALIGLGLLAGTRRRR